MSRLQTPLMRQQLPLKFLLLKLRLQNPLMQKELPRNPDSIEIFGHRGARGFFPENTLLGFTETLKMGVDGIEMDVVISHDRKVVVSHEPWMNPKICTAPDGSPVKNGIKHNLFRMNYAEIKKFDCGKRTDKNFPLQKPFPACKPLLSEMIDATLADVIKKKAKYLIEIKSSKITENKFHPLPDEFSRLVYEVIKEKKCSEHCWVISFDCRILRCFRELNQKIKTGLLFRNLYSVKKNIKPLGFVPSAYLPHHRLVTKKMVREACALGVKVIAWTVNTQKRMLKLSEMNVDGIITDYPDKAIRTYTRTSAS